VGRERVSKRRPRGRLTRLPGRRRAPLRGRLTAPRTSVRRVRCSPAVYFATPMSATTPAATTTRPTVAATRITCGAAHRSDFVMRRTPPKHPPKSPPKIRQCRSQRREIRAGQGTGRALTLSLTKPIRPAGSVTGHGNVCRSHSARGASGVHSAQVVAGGSRERINEQWRSRVRAVIDCRPRGNADGGRRLAGRPPNLSISGPRKRAALPEEGAADHSESGHSGHYGCVRIRARCVRASVGWVGSRGDDGHIRPSSAALALASRSAAASPRHALTGRPNAQNRCSCPISCLISCGRSSSNPKWRHGSTRSR
jgi:hypothetical protein